MPRSLATFLAGGAALALVLAAALPAPARAAAAPEPGKGVGALGCVRPIVPGTRWRGLPVGPDHCVAEAARFRSGWCARELSDGKDWPWVGPTATRRAALLKNFAQSYGRDGC